MSLEDIEKYEWTDLLTPQEYLLAGLQVERSYSNKWYTPIIVQHGLDPNTIDQIRKAIGTFKASSVYWRNQKEEEFNGLVEVTLSLLNEDGATLNDPQPLDKTLRIRQECKERLRLRE